jgi:hypothetical protein
MIFFKKTFTRLLSIEFVILRPAKACGRINLIFNEVHTTFFFNSTLCLRAMSGFLNGEYRSHVTETKSRQVQ